MTDVFQIKQKADLEASLLNYILGSAVEVNDMNVGSVVRSILGAVAQEEEEIYFRQWAATKQAILQGILYSFGFSPVQGTTASGTVTFGRETQAPADYLVPEGTELISANGLKYKTTTNVTLLANTTSIDAPVVSETTGSSTNIQGIGTPLQILNTIVGVSTAVTSSEIAGGTDTESQTSLMTRFSMYLNSLSRSTRGSVEYAALSTQLVDGSGNITEQVKAAKARDYQDDVTIPRGEVLVYIDNGVGAPSGQNMVLNGDFEGGLTTGFISSATLNAGGTGYAVGDTGTINGGNSDATYTITSVSGGAVTGFSIVQKGTGYSAASGVATSYGGTQPGTGTGFTVNTVIDSGWSPQSAVIDTTISHWGSHSSKLVAAGSSVYGALSDPVVVDITKKYNLSLWNKVTEYSTGKYKTRIRFYSDAGGTTEISSSAVDLVVFQGTTNDWVITATTVGPGQSIPFPATTASVRIEHYWDTIPTGTAYMDTVMFYDQSLLIAQVKKIIDGYESGGVVYDGYKADGVVASVLPVDAVKINVSVAVDSDYFDMAQSIVESAITIFFANLGFGESVDYNILISSIITCSEYVKDAESLSLVVVGGATYTSDVPITATQRAVINTLSVTAV